MMQSRARRGEKRGRHDISEESASKMESDCKLLLTGGTGSFGKAFTKRTLERFNPKKIVIFSRDEMKQWEVSQLYVKDERVLDREHTPTTHWFTRFLISRSSREEPG